MIYKANKIKGTAGLRNLTGEMNGEVITHIRVEKNSVIECNRFGEMNSLNNQCEVS